ncbi:MAG: ATP-binding protein, partial [Rubrobacter sp.]
TGLGLALAGEISQHLGGDIYVKSRKDVGSTFSAVLPLDAAAPNGGGPPRKNGVRPGRAERKP